VHVFVFYKKNELLNQDDHEQIIFEINFFYKFKIMFYLFFSITTQCKIKFKIVLNEIHKRKE
jgi:hypothetical protein